MGVHLEEEACVEINFNQRKKKHMENKKINGFNLKRNLVVLILEKESEVGSRIHGEREKNI